MQKWVGVQGVRRGLGEGCLCEAELPSRERFKGNMTKREPVPMLVCRIQTRPPRHDSLLVGSYVMSLHPAVPDIPFSHLSPSCECSLPLHLHGKPL